MSLDSPRPSAERLRVGLSQRVVAYRLLLSQNIGVSKGTAHAERVRFPLAQPLPAGPWDAGIALGSGLRLLERGADATVAFPDSGAAAAVLVNSGGATWR